MSDKSVVQVALGIGSNLNRRRHIQHAISRLRTGFGELLLSPVYRSPAAGFDGPEFFNLVCVLHTNLAVFDLQSSLKQIEHLEGRVRGSHRSLSRTLDIDILFYGDANLRQQGLDIPRAEILEYAFVLRPLSDLLPDQEHPLERKSYLALWRKLAVNKPQLWLSDWMPA
ncbi:MAG: 2-amino-4-hydroxy-6-hydroxymethyldihydropteridine diphosphokinase [Gammaproteobacteria bacterium]|jgi:2-amino-4-hydroxy-6-hydroxymethyldihydropteridine diphosphokinase